jgi:aryl-alcohol dehydrogenase-like predicted oxidoreductase
MQYRHLGRTGIQVSELSIGSWVTFKNQVDVKRSGRDHGGGV